MSVNGVPVQGVSVYGDYVQGRGLCLWCLCPGEGSLSRGSMSREGSLSRGSLSGRSLSKEISVKVGVSLLVVSVQWGLFMGSLSGIFVQEGL